MYFIDVDDTSFALDIIDDCLLDFVQDTWMNDDLSDLLDDKEPLDELVDELHPKYNIEEHERELKLFNHRISGTLKRWKQFTTNKKSISPSTSPRA